MFTVTIFRETTDGETVEKTREGVVDVKTFPKLDKAQLTYKGDRETETLLLGTVHVESPLK